MRPSNTEHVEAGSLRNVRLLRPYGTLLVLIVSLLFVLTFVDMAQPYFLKLLIDEVFPRPGEAAALSEVTATGAGNWGLLWFILPAMGLIYVARNALFFASRMFSLRVSEDLCFDLRKRLFDHLQQLSLRFYRTHQPGKIGSRLMDDTFKIQSFIQDKLPTFARYFLEAQVLLIIIYVVNWRLALASTIVLPLHFWTYRKFRGPIRKSHSEAQENLAIAHGNIVEKFLGMEVVKGFSAEDRESTTFREAIDASRRSQMRSQRYHFTQKVAADLIVGVGTVLLLGYGAMEVRHGRMTGGEFFMFFWYTKMLYPAVLEVISGAGHLSKASASVDRVFEMLEEPTADADVPARGGVDTAALAGRIEYEHVGFSYDEHGASVLKDISFTIEPGEHVAITGPSGCGKSTLMSLLPRFNDPTKGRVLIDGRPANTIPIRALRGLFGIVFQEVFLFDASIYENIRYARADATLDEIVEACRITGADETINHLPDGYHTKIGASGCDLSRGEKQRITLARALVRDPRILIIDEATASIDAAASRDIIYSILSRMKGRTVIMITHHTELLDFVDRVIAVEHGGIAYDGPVADFPPAIAARLAANGSPVPSPHEHRPDATDDQPTSPVIEIKGRSRPQRGPFTTGGLATLLIVGLLIAVGCVRTPTKVSQSFEVDNPRISHGVLLDEPDPDRLRELAEALDAIALDPKGIELDDAPLAALTADLPDQDIDMPVFAAAFDEDQPASGKEATTVAAPAGAVRLITLPKLSDIELSELLDNLAMGLSAEHAYGPAEPSLTETLPPLPEGVIAGRAVAKASETGTRVIQFAYRRFISQPPRLYVLGVVIAADGSQTANPDLDLIEPVVNQLVASLGDMRGNLPTHELEACLIQLSYTNATSAIAMLKGMGITAMNQPTDIPQTADFTKLPYVVGIPDPAANEVGLVGGSDITSGGFGTTSIPRSAGPLSPNTLAVPMTQLLILFHPAHPEQFSRVRQLLDDLIDRPARQIFVEGMILEISESGLEDLGIEWQLEEGPIKWSAGSLQAFGENDTMTFETTDLDFWRVFNRNFEWDWSVKIRTLISDGKAEVLSRPSVLTINNRQASIRVGQDIPVATSQDANITGTTAKLSFNFKYIPTGIMLNIRPRINEDGSEVTMLIDAIVSAVVPGADLELRSADGDLMAYAPTISSRRVQTYARIKNNTPLIIGGLVSRQHVVIKDKVPLLGDLPIVGALFRASRTEDTKTEVIIVITPYVLPEELLIPRSLPKDEDYFDSFGHRLFRDAYRIRSEDVFDLNFLFENKRLTTYRDLAREAINRNFRLAEVEPFQSFAGDRIPGENVLVTRMIYEVIKRLDVADHVALSKIIYFEGQKDVGGYDVRFLDAALAKLGGGFRHWNFFRNLEDKALAMTYYYDRESMEAGYLSSEPIPHLALVECPGRGAWGKLLWEMNQPTEDGRERYTILIHNESDLVRLRRALALKRIVTLNGGAPRLLLREFSVGKVLLMPELKDDQIHVIDADVAKYFFRTEHYYAAMIAEIEDRLTQLDTVLRHEPAPEAPVEQSP
ncbi:MAG: ATP-binding cassette domain-containing protein [Phycisphaerales bacterium]|nr:ATP-binding cassette domain-containing protein [Phycisphaerales bacterium]